MTAFPCSACGRVAVVPSDVSLPAVLECPACGHQIQLDHWIVVAGDERVDETFGSVSNHDQPHVSAPIHVDSVLEVPLLQEIPSGHLRSTEITGDGSWNSAQTMPMGYSAASRRFRRWQIAPVDLAAVVAAAFIVGGFAIWTWDGYGYLKSRIRGEQFEANPSESSDLAAGSKATVDLAVPAKLSPEFIGRWKNTTSISETLTGFRSAAEVELQAPRVPTDTEQFADTLKHCLHQATLWTRQPLERAEYRSIARLIYFSLLRAADLLERPDEDRLAWISEPLASLAATLCSQSELHPILHQGARYWLTENQASQSFSLAVLIECASAEASEGSWQYIATRDAVIKEFNMTIAVPCTQTNRIGSGQRLLLLGTVERLAGADSRLPRLRFKSRYCYAL